MPSIEQAVTTVIIALVAAATGAWLKDWNNRRDQERARREKQGDKTTLDLTQLESKRIDDEAARRREVDEAAREIRDFLKQQLLEVNASLDELEHERKQEAAESGKLRVALTTLEIEHARLRANSEIEVARLNRQVVEQERQTNGLTGRVDDLESAVRDANEATKRAEGRAEAAERKSDYILVVARQYEREYGDITEGGLNTYLETYRITQA